METARTLMSYKNVPREKMPREKMLRLGIASLTDIELLALFLRTGTPERSVLAFAEYLVAHFGSLYDLLSADAQQFAGVSGIGVAKFAQLKGIAELARRYHASSLQEALTLDSPQATRAFLQSQLADEPREIFLVIYLNNQNRVLRHSRLFSGTLSHVEVHPREIVREAIAINAAAVILAHNHPSGYAEPSFADKQITERVVKCCEFMDIRVLDHLVVGRGEWVSFAERGWI